MIRDRPSGAIDRVKTEKEIINHQSTDCLRHAYILKCVTDVSVRFGTDFNSIG
jgi:hypothetical protein